MLPGRDLVHPEFGANVATLALAVVSTLTYYVCWRWSEIARVRRMAKVGRAGSPALPSPVPVLPRWIPFIGGHSLQLETEKVGIQGPRDGSICSVLFLVGCRLLRSLRRTQVARSFRIP